MNKRSGKIVVLTLDGGNGWALFKASHESVTNEGMIISKAEKNYPKVIISITLTVFWGPFIRKAKLFSK